MLDLGSSFLASVERCPSHLAIVDGDIRRSYEEWLSEILSLVTGLNRLGVAKGDRIVTVLQNRYEAATLHWACQFTGIIITPINWRALPEEIDYAVENSGAAAIFYEDATAAAVIGTKTTAIIHRVGVDSKIEGDHCLQEMLACTPSSACSKASAEDVSVMLYTSGTTGRGKGVPRLHRAERSAAVAHLAQNQYKHHEVTLGVMPLYHTMGIRSLITMSLVNGSFICLPRFDKNAALDLIEQEKISSLYLVPTLYHDIIHAPGFDKRDISSVKKLGYAGANMTDGLLKQLDEKFAPELFVNHYGSSEIYTFTVEPNAASKPGSAGKAGLNQHIKVVSLNSTDANDTTAPDQEGQIIASMQNDEAFQGYWHRPEADAAAIHGEWYFTGDIGYFDQDGDLFVTGRVDDMIISGGENILPSEIESVLSLHDAVGEVAVVGLQHERLGMQVSAFVQRSGPVTNKELDDWCIQSDLAPFKRPRAYFFVTEIPKSPVGKLLRRKLVAGEYELE